jgi:hypothetical protein
MELAVQKNLNGFREEGKKSQKMNDDQRLMLDISLFLSEFLDLN